MLADYLKLYEALFHAILADRDGSALRQKMDVMWRPAWKHAVREYGYELYFEFVMGMK